MAKVKYKTFDVWTIDEDGHLEDHRESFDNVSDAKEYIIKDTEDTEYAIIQQEAIIESRVTKKTTRKRSMDKL